MSREPVRQSQHRGASSAHLSLQARLGAWLEHHGGSAADALLRLSDTPMATLLTSLVVAIALALPATLLIVFGNVQQLSERWDARPRVLVYINRQAAPEAVDKWVAGLSTDEAIEAVEFISAEKALAEFRKESGFGDVLKLLDENPLPATVVITPTDSALLEDRMAALLKRLQASALVGDVDVDLEWVRRLREITVLCRHLVLTLATLLGLGVLLSIGNTIRLAIENRREEIVVTKLVGGTDGFVRRPFLYTGAWYGLFGGLIACLLVSAAFASIAPAVRSLLGSYQSDFEFQHLNLGGVLLILLISAGLGWLGAGLAVGRHLADIQPR